MDCLLSPQLPDKMFHVRVTPGGNQGYEAITTCKITSFKNYKFQNKCSLCLCMDIPNFPSVGVSWLSRLEHSVHEWCVGDERLMYLFIQVPASIYEGLLLNLEMWEKSLTFVEDFFYLRSTWVVIGNQLGGSWKMTPIRSLIHPPFFCCSDLQQQLKLWEEKKLLFLIFII